jgi:hypothetical protein
MQNGVVKLASCILAADLARSGRTGDRGRRLCRRVIIFGKKRVCPRHGQSVRSHCPSSRLIPFHLVTSRLAEQYEGFAASETERCSTPIACQTRLARRSSETPLSRSGFRPYPRARLEYGSSITLPLIMIQHHTSIQGIRIANDCSGVGVISTDAATSIH